MNFDGKSQMLQEHAVVPLARTAGVTNGNIISCANAEAITVIVYSGAYSSGGFTPKIIAGDQSNLSDGVEVTDDFLIGTEAAAKITAANQVFSIGVNSKKKFFRVDFDADASSSATFGALVVKHHLNKAPI